MIEQNTVISAIIMTITAVLLVLLAALSLKFGPNSLLGLRLPWTVQNKKIWQASQQILFITFVPMSIGIIVVAWSIVVAWTIKDNPVLIILPILAGLVMVVVNTIFISIYTYVLSKKDEYKE
ncbi:SdpI family protein [Thermicanus aegyptius]|uniref:SdpI family protein n=1 Tax=Thermicanus aegyptius TaxID=94009 RepID=UPI00048CC4F9|nr:SdpI family protein [Thermicanus aegyptius]